MKHHNPGSAYYYSVLYLDESKRQTVIAMRELFHELSGIVLQCSEPQLAETKLLWWKNELQQSTSQHPLLKILSPTHHHYFQTIIDAFLRDLHTPMYEKQQKLLDFYHQTAGEMESHLASVYEADEHTKENLCNFGVFIQLVTHLRDLRLLMKHGRTYLSGENLIEHHVTLKDLSKYQLTDNIRQLFKSRSQLAKYYYDKAQENLSKTQRKKILPTLILAKLHKVLLDEIEQADFPILQQRIGLTPLRKWWIAWKQKSFI